MIEKLVKLRRIADGQRSVTATSLRDAKIQVPIASAAKYPGAAAVALVNAQIGVRKQL